MTYSVELPKPAYDIVLRDAAGVEVGLIAVNANGEHDPTSIVRTPVERSSLKMSQGNQSYSDLEPPYTVLAQDDWSGGRGGRVYEDDVTRFYSSLRANTGRAEKIILGGRETYGTGYRKADAALPGSMQIIQLIDAYAYMAVRFVVSDNYTMDKIALWIGYKGEAGTLTASLYTDSSGPAVLITSKSITTASLREEMLTELYPFDMTNQALTLPNHYWIVIHGSVGTTANHWKVGVGSGGGTTVKSTDGAVWTSETSYKLYYRVMDNTADVGGEFFLFNDELYFVTMPSTGTSKLWVNSSNAWSDVTPAAMNGIVTDVVVCNKLVIFAQGTGAGTNYMFLMKGPSSALVTSIHSGYKADFIEMFNDGGTVKIARIVGTEITYAAEPTWGLYPSWLGTTQVGHDWEGVNGLVRYATDEGVEAVWVLKESGPWEYDGTNIASKAREEMRAVASTQLGKVAKKSDVYLWISVMNTIWRFYSPTFDDVGFMLDEGLPSNMRGVVTCIVTYPGRTMVSVDAGAAGYSCILENNGGAAWHEVYRAPYGERIYRFEIQVVAGTAPDKLWIRQGADFLWMPLPSDGFDPTQDTAYPYTHEGAVEMCDMFAGLQDAWKYWSALKMVLEELEDDTTWVEADYKLDDGAWVALPDEFTEMPIDEKEFGETDEDGRTFGVSSKKFKLRIRLYSVDTLKTPVVRSVIVEAVTVNQPKFTYSLVAKIGSKDLNGAPDETTKPYQKVGQLDTWSGEAQSLWMTCINPLFTGRAVFLAPVPNRPLTVSEYENEFEYTTTIVLQEA